MDEAEQDLGTKPLPDEGIPELTGPVSFNGKLERYLHSRSSQKKGQDRHSHEEATPAASRPKRKSQAPHTPHTTRSAKSPYFSADDLGSTSSSSRRQSRSVTSSPRRQKRDNGVIEANPPNNLRDSIPPNLILLLVGLNPGLMTGVTGWAYAHPSNLFWKLLHSSGITSIRHPPSDTYLLPELYAVGNTNIVSRPTKDGSMLSRREMDEGVPILEQKVREQRPEAVCIVGKSIWESIWRVRKGRGIRKEEFHYGWQDESENMGVIAPARRGGSSQGDGEGWKGARVFVATTTSGLAAGMKPAEKEAVWKVLGTWVKERREKRKQDAQASGLDDK